MRSKYIYINRDDYDDHMENEDIKKEKLSMKKKPFEENEYLRLSRFGKMVVKNWEKTNAW